MVLASGLAGANKNTKVTNGIKNKLKNGLEIYKMQYQKISLKK